MMTKTLASAVAVLAVCGIAMIASAPVAPASAAECHGSPSPDAQPNKNPIYTAPPTFIRSVRNAKLYQAGGGNDTIRVVHVYGTPYEMGFAHGTIVKEEATAFMHAVWAYLEGQVESAINGTVHNLKPWFVDLVAELGLDLALDVTMDMTKPFSGKYFYEEMQGMADATGVNVKLIERVHMIGSLTQGACSMYGAWGNATVNGDPLQLRALDWDVDGPFKDYPQLTVYHPNNDSSNGHAFINIGWTGWIGSITGYSSVSMAISEIGVAFPDSTFGKESRIGVPFVFLLRDILQFDQTLDDAMKRITDAHRTCDLIFGVGDGKQPGPDSFRGVQYSASVANFYTDTDNEPEADWHPRIKDVVYYGMDWLCPGYNKVLAQRIQSQYGNITPQTTIEQITSITQTGDLHIAIYDLKNQVFYTANARRDGADGPAKAYDRSFVRIDAAALFKETQ